MANSAVRGGSRGGAGGGMNPALVGAPGASATAPLISVVIPHYNDHAALEGCLAALAAQRADGVPFEIIVVDNGSHAMPTAVCEAFPDVQLLLETTPGPGPARNRGTRRARGEILAFVDADCPPAPGWIVAIAGAFATPAVGVIGGDVRIAPANPARMTVVEAYESVFGYRFELYIARDKYTGTGNMAVRRRIFEEVGPFAGIGFAEDMEWGRRATTLGHDPAYVPAMRVFTPARRNFAELARKWDRHVAHFFAQNRMHPRPRLRWLLLTALVAASPLAEALTIWRSDRLERGVDRWRALVGVTRLRLYRARQMLRLARGLDPAELSGSWRQGGSTAASVPGPDGRC